MCSCVFLFHVDAFICSRRRVCYSAFTFDLSLFRGDEKSKPYVRIKIHFPRTISQRQSFFVLTEQVIIIVTATLSHILMRRNFVPHFNLHEQDDTFKALPIMNFPVLFTVSFSSKLVGCIPMTGFAFRQHCDNYLQKLLLKPGAESVYYQFTVYDS